MMNNQRGFSLIELLVVMVIIAFLMGMVGIGLFQNDVAGELDDQAEELRQQLRWASDEALITGESIGLVPVRLQGGVGVPIRWSVEFYRFRDYEWQQAGLLEPFPLHEKLQIELIIDDEIVDFLPWLDKEAPDPAMIFYGGGEATEGIWRLSIQPRYLSEVDPEQRREAHLTITMAGDIAWKERDEDRERLSRNGGF